MIVIYTTKVTNRIKYTADFVFSQYFGIEYEFTDNPEIIIVPDKVYLNYTPAPKNGFFNIFQDNLLLENDIREQKIFVSREADMPVFFQTVDNFDIRFDIFSCIFYLLSRYEEYLPHDKDVHGRYKSSNSILAKKEFNFSPIAETWLIFLKEELLKINPNLPFKKYEFEYVPTFDIDNAFRYLGRNWFRKPPNIFSSNCLPVLFRQKEDPFDIFDKLLKEIDKYNLNSVFFFLLSDKYKNDSNVSPVSKKLHAVIKKVSDKKIGIHPSYLALEKNILQEEKLQLEKITHQTITFSRQHFLKINFPEYYRKIAASGLQTDFSLCYPDVAGFRAGCSRPFYFFDIERDKCTSLIIQPSCWMDATYEYYQALNNDELRQNFLTIFNQLKKINGILVPIFHNDLLAMDKYWGIFGFINLQIVLGDEK